MASPGAYATASIAHQVIGARKPQLHDKAVVFEEEIKHPLSKILTVNIAPLEMM
jgi:hypothetical protein